MRDLGLSEGAISRRLSNGGLHPRFRGVYAVGRPEVSPRGTLSAVLLACGDGAALSHETAAELWGIGHAPGDEVHVSVGELRHPLHAKICVHRRTPMPPVGVVDGLRVVDPLHTLLDVAVTWPPWRLERAVNEADKLGVVSFDRALASLPSLAGKRGIRRLRRTLMKHAVTDSDLERAFLELIGRAGLPAPLTQREVVGLRVDFFWPDLGLIVETDGLTYHRTPSQQARDRRRDQALTAAGFVCLRFTNAQVRREQAIVVSTLRSVANRLRQGD